MSNSPLVVYTKISPNRNSPRNHKIDKITIHHMAGNLSIETCGNVFAPKSRGASSNYGVGSDGRIGMYCEEKDRSWCSSSPKNDHRAVTIEVANDGGAPNWHVSDKALEATIKLCVDICKRNGIKKLNYTGNKNGNLTEHNYFANTTCPGPYLKSKLPYIAKEVNKRLGASETEPTTPTKLKFKVGDKVVINGDLYRSSTASSPNGKVSNKVTQITRVAEGAKHPYNTTGDLGWMNESDIKAYTAKKSIEELAQEVIDGKWGNDPQRSQKLTAEGYDAKAVQARVDEILYGGKTTTSTTFKKGDKVRVKKGAKDYNGVQLASFVYDTVYTVLEAPKGDRVVIGLNGQVTCAIKSSNLYK